MVIPTIAYSLFFSAFVIVPTNLLFDYVYALFLYEIENLINEESRYHQYTISRCPVRRHKATGSYTYIEAKQSIEEEGYYSKFRCSSGSYSVKVVCQASEHSVCSRNDQCCKLLAKHHAISYSRKADNISPVAHVNGVLVLILVPVSPLMSSRLPTLSSRKVLNLIVSTS